MRIFSRLAAVALAAGTLLTAPLSAWAQAPANDRCVNATPLQPTGSFGFGNTANANDDLIGLLGCQSGTSSTAHPDVWFTFQATGTQLDFNVSAVNASTPKPLEVLVFSGACATSLIVLGSQCGQSQVTGRVGGLVTGQSYLVAVSSPSAQDTTQFGIQLTTSTPPITAAQDCNQAAVLANGTAITQPSLTNGLGVDPNEVDPNNSCWGSGGERQPKWYKFVAGATGKFQFSILPNNLTDDYDWAIWDITSDPTGCTTKGDAVACNWTGARGATGLSLCPNQEPGYQGGDQFDNTTTGLTGANAPITMTAGHAYALLVDNFSTSSAGFQLVFGGACPQGTVLDPLAQISLDAEFTYTKVSCSEVNFQKVRQLDPNTVTAAYFWNFGDGVTSTVQNPSHTYSPSGVSTYTVTLQVIDVLGGRNTFSRQITIAPPVLQVAASVPIDSTTLPTKSVSLCGGDSVQFMLNGADTYSWSPATGLNVAVGANVTARPDSTTQYIVTATRDQCTSVDTITVLVSRPIQLALAATDTLICAGASTTISARGAASYQWSPSVGLSSVTDSTVTVTLDSTTTYTVLATRGSCTATATVRVQVQALPTTRIVVADTIVDLGATVTLKLRGATSYVFDDPSLVTRVNDSTYTASPTAATEYRVTGSIGNCSTPAARALSVLSPAYNIITPNGDGKNETFTASVSVRPIHLKVYNRWGRKVLDQDNYKNDWNGGDLPAGTYYYHIEDTSGKTWKGWLQIVR